MLLYLSSSSKVYDSLFSGQTSLKSKFEKLTNECICGRYSHKFSVLDLFVWVFGEIDDSKIIHLKDHIDQLAKRDSKLINIDFLIKSEHSIEHLCTRNIHSHFQSFFPHDYYNLLSIVRKTPINTKLQVQGGRPLQRSL